MAAPILRIGLAQMAPVLGRPDTNLARHLDYLDRARDAGVALLVFPELSLTGYAVEAMVDTVARTATADDPLLAALLAAAGDMAVVVGFVERDSRQRHYAAAAFLHAGRLLHVHRKIFLPTYHIFNEGRYLARGEHVRAFDTPWGRVAMLICEDFWHMSTAYLAWQDGADLLLLMSAGVAWETDETSPAAEEVAGAELVDRLVGVYAGSMTTFVAHCNRVGEENGVRFRGGSMIIGPTGAPLAQAPVDEEWLLTAELDWQTLAAARRRFPALRDARPHWFQRQLAASLQRQGEENDR